MIIRAMRKLWRICVLLPRYRRTFGRFGKGSMIVSSLRVDGGQRISIHDNVLINSQTWLAAKPLTRMENCQLDIREGAVIGHFNHIYCTHSITIEENVLTADRVYISDNLHSYEDINIPIMYQPIKQLRAVTIGAGAWLGEGVCIIGANVGRGSVIGANSVVTKDIPDYCVAVGAPARVVKQYNPATCQWEKII